MKIEKLFPFFCLILISCQTPTQIEISQYAGRPIVNDPCISNGDGTCYRNGELIENTENFLMGEIDDYNPMQSHVEKLEKFYYYCTKFNQCEPFKKANAKPLYND